MSPKKQDHMTIAIVMGSLFLIVLLVAGLSTVDFGTTYDNQVFYKNCRQYVKALEDGVVQKDSDFKLIDGNNKPCLIQHAVDELDVDHLVITAPGPDGEMETPDDLVVSYKANLPTSMWTRTKRAWGSN